MDSYYNTYIQKVGMIFKTFISRRFQMMNKINKLETQKKKHIQKQSNKITAITI